MCIVGKRCDHGVEFSCRDFAEGIHVRCSCNLAGIVSAVNDQGSQSDHAAIGGCTVTIEQAIVFFFREGQSDFIREGLSKIDD